MPAFKKMEASQTRMFLEQEEKKRKEEEKLENERTKMDRSFQMEMFKMQAQLQMQMMSMFSKRSEKPTGSQIQLLEMHPISWDSDSL